jgi:hypothetical protein
VRSSRVVGEGCRAAELGVRSSGKGLGGVWSSSGTWGKRLDGVSWAAAGRRTSGRECRRRSMAEPSAAPRPELLAATREGESCCTGKQWTEGLELHAATGEKGVAPLAKLWREASPPPKKKGGRHRRRRRRREGGGGRESLAQAVEGCMVVANMAPFAICSS